jgi:immune inhibitor A
VAGACIMNRQLNDSQLSSPRVVVSPGVATATFSARILTLALPLVLLLATFLPSHSTAMPLRPDVLERLGVREGLPVAATEAVATGLNVPVQKFSMDLSGMPEGETAQLRVVVILVEFPDLRADTVLHNARYYEDLLFEGTRWNQKTMRNFYLENSYGKLEIVGEIYGWYMAPNPSIYYAAANAGICSVCYPRNARKLVEDALGLAEPDIDFSRFDDDGSDGVPASGDDDGYVDAVFVVHAGPSFEETGNPNYILSHQWTTVEPVDVDGVSVYVYAIEAEPSNIGTFCHEMGHILGLPDLYDMEYDSYALDVWSLMGSGGWLDDGETPSHLDAWCKTKLGFLEPVVPEENVDGIILDPIEGHPDVYRIWKNGQEGREYFLLENRQKVGFDAFLPGSGLLIYHVDETMKNNNNQWRYLVGLEQADGMFDLERRDSPSWFGADAGDPFPGWAHNSEFTNFSVPNSFSNEGRDVEVRVTDISLPGGRASFNLKVETNPQLVISKVLTDDSETGDGDGNPDAGEVARFRCLVKNIGLASRELTATASCANAYATLLEDTVRYGSLDEDEELLPQEAFVFEIDSVLAEDPYRVYFLVDFADDFFFSHRETLVVGVGDSLGLRDDFESGEGEWVHRGIQTVDDWHLTSTRAFGGQSSWHCGLEDSAAYSSYQDSYLKTCFLIVGAQSRLTYYQWLDVENENTRLAWDGCLVEVSSDNVHWFAVEPVGGYPYVIDMRADTDGAERGCFSGRERQWERVEFDLSAYSGALWVRFRMISDGETSGEGWYIDDVDITTTDEPYTIAFENVWSSPEEVAVTWRVIPRTSPYDGQGMTLLRRTADNGVLAPADLGPYEVIYEDTSRFTGLHSFVDTSVVEGTYYTYAIRDIYASGAAYLIEGPLVYVPNAIYSVRLMNCSPNPYLPASGTLSVDFQLPDGNGGPRWQRITVMVIDVSGRVVAVPFDDRAPSGPRTVTWDGTDTQGRAVPSGVYLVTVQTSDERFSKKILLLK